MIKKFTQLDGMLLYVCVPNPVKGYKDPKAAFEPGMEWKASVAVTDEDTIDEFEAYAKSCGANVSVKKVITSDFAAVYKTEPPEDAGKKLWVVTLRKKTTLGKTEKEVPDIYKPKVFLAEGDEFTDITNDPDQIVGNGSIGSMSIDVFHRDNGTASFYLKNILVETLVPFVRTEGTTSDYTPGEEFSRKTKAAPAPAEAPKTKAVSPKASAKAPAKSVPASQEPINDDIPF